MVAQNFFPKTRGPRKRASSLYPFSASFPVPVTIGLLLVDAILIVLYIGLALFLRAEMIESIPKLWRIDRDWSLGEMFNYLKWLALAGMSITLFWRRNAIIFLGIAVLSMVALLDDSMQLHECFEYAAMPKMGLNLPRGVGEMIFVAAEGTLILGLVMYGWIRAAPSVRRQVVPLLMLLGGTVCCAVALDFLHIHVSENAILDAAFGILEDGGEMVFLSLAVSYAAGLVLQGKAAAFD